MTTMQDILVRDVLKTQLHATRTHGLIHRDWKANPASLAGLALDASEGDEAQGMQMLFQAIAYLRRVQTESGRPMVFIDDDSQNELIESLKREVESQ